MRAMALGLALAWLLGCGGTVPPYTRVYSPIRAEPEPLVFVTVNEQREALENALRGAGVALSPNLRAATLLLRAKLGSRRGGDRCGAIRNVLFDLRENGERVAVLKGRGWVGSHEVFDTAPREALPSRLRDQRAHQARRESGLDPLGEPHCAAPDESPNILRDMSEELARMLSARR